MGLGHEVEVEAAIAEWELGSCRLPCRLLLRRRGGRRRCLICCHHLVAAVGVVHRFVAVGVEGRIAVLVSLQVQKAPRSGPWNTSSRPLAVGTGIETEVVNAIGFDSKKQRV